MGLQQNISNKITISFVRIAVKPSALSPNRWTRYALVHRSTPCHHTMHCMKRNSCFLSWALFSASVTREYTFESWFNGPCNLERTHVIWNVPFESNYLEETTALTYNAYFSFLCGSCSKFCINLCTDTFSKIIVYKIMIIIIFC